MYVDLCIADMNLHSIVSPIIAAVNPMLPVTVRISSGNATGADGTRTPSYATAYQARAQVQPMSSSDLRRVDGLNLQGTMVGIYLSGDIEGVVRPLSKGGDLITFPDGSIYLVVVALENWGATPAERWSKVACQLQMPG